MKALGKIYTLEDTKIILETIKGGLSQVKGGSTAISYTDAFCNSSFRRSTFIGVIVYMGYHLTGIAAINNYSTFILK